MANVFVSYAREDLDFAEVVQAKLERAGHETLADVDLLSAGEQWQDELNLAIRRSHALVVVMTPAARASENVAYEWAFALGAGVRVIVLELTATSFHSRLDSLHRLSFIDKARPWEGLLAEVRKAETAGPATLPELDSDVPAVVKLAARALNSLEPAERRAAVATLAAARGDAARQLLAQALEHPVRDVRVAAARLFPDRSDVRLVRGLLESLAELDWDIVRWQVERRFDELVALGAAAVPGLLAAFAEHPELRWGIIFGLGRIRDRRALPTLVSELHTGGVGTRSAAAEALGAIGDIAAAAHLRQALDDPNEYVRAAAAEALGHLKDPESTAALVALLEGDVAMVRAAAARALGKLGDGSAVPALTKALADPNVDVQMVAAESLAELGEEAGREHLRSLIAADTEEINGEEAKALEALIRLDDTKAMPTIERRLLSFHEGTRPNIDALADGSLAAQRVLVHLLDRGYESEAVAAALKRVQTPEAQAALKRWRLRLKR